MSKILKQVRCGRMVYAVVYTPPARRGWAPGQGAEAESLQRGPGAAERQDLLRQAGAGAGGQL